MDQEKKFDGCLIQKTDFNRKDLFDIRQDIIEGVPVNLIARKHHIGEKRLRYLFSELIIQMDNVRTFQSHGVIGHKNSAYYTEEEQLAGIPNYTWEELSRTEQQFYLNYGREGKTSFKSARHCGIDRSLEQSIRLTDEERARIPLAG